jgi:predicted PurR-regulated permease PerM
MTMKFNTRVFWRLISIFAVLDLCLLMTACGDWESQASSIITLLGPAIQALVAILAAFGVGVSEEVMTQFNNWAQQAQTALVTIKGLIDSYQNAEADAQPGLLNEIQAALTVVQSQLAAILPELHITDPNSAAKVTAALEAISAFLVSLAALIPAVAQAKGAEDEKALFEKSQETVKQFKKDFNEAVGYFGKQYELK